MKKYFLFFLFFSCLSMSKGQTVNVKKNSLVVNSSTIDIKEKDTLEIFSNIEIDSVVIIVKSYVNDTKKYFELLGSPQMQEPPKYLLSINIKRAIINQKTITGAGFIKKIIISSDLEKNGTFPLSGKCKLLVYIKGDKKPLYTLNLIKT